MWTPEREDLLIELAGTIDDEDTSLVERDGGWWMNGRTWGSDKVGRPGSRWRFGLFSSSSWTELKSALPRVGAYPRTYMIAPFFPVRAVHACPA
jgi:hypothetical protein